MYCITPTWASALASDASEAFYVMQVHKIIIITSISISDINFSRKVKSSNLLCKYQQYWNLFSYVFSHFYKDQY